MNGQDDGDEADLQYRTEWGLMSQIHGSLKDKRRRIPGSRSGQQTFLLAQSLDRFH